MLSLQLAQANSSLADLKGHVEVTEEKVHMTQSELAQARSRAESIRKDQVAAAQKLNTQLTEVQRTAKKRWCCRDGSGRSEKGYRKHAERPGSYESKLDRAQGDMGVMSGLIARNHDDLEDLKRRGDRNYYEFTVRRRRHRSALVRCSFR